VTRLRYALCTIYTAAFVWLAWQTVTTYGREPLWSTALSVAVSVVLVIAFIQQLELADRDREAARLRQQETRRRLVAEGQPLDAHEAAAFNRLAASVNLPGPDEPRSAA
jgi:low affinity Fe/Cu permease